MRGIYRWIILACFLGFSCDEPNELVPLNYPRLSLESEDESVNLGESINVKIKIKNVDIPLFGTYLKISIDTSKFEINENNFFQIGEYWGDNSISFDHYENENLHFTIVNTQIHEETTSDGILGHLNFRALASGETELNFFNQECEFYNLLGEIIDIPDLEFENISIKIN